MNMTEFRAPRRTKVSATSFTDGHAQRIADSVGVRDGKLVLVEGEDTWRALRAAHRLLGHYGYQSDEAIAESRALCVDYWNERFSTMPCHYCVGMVDVDGAPGFEVNRDGVCIMCEGTRVHPDGDDPHDDGEGWNGDDCVVCGGVS